MGDYTQLIVNAAVSLAHPKEFYEELEAKVLNLRGSSFYHCGGAPSICEFGENHAYKTVSLMTQTKDGRGQEEFLMWLKPHVKAGMGEKEIWAIQIWESGEPKLWQLGDGGYMCARCGDTSTPCYCSS